MTDNEIIRSVDTDIEAQQGELDAVAAAFRRAGFDVTVNASYITRSVDLAPWLIAVMLATPITAFFTQLGSEAGKDAYPALKALVKDLWQARTRADGSIDLEDPDGTHLILATRIPDQALDALADVDWAAKRGHYLVWDDTRDEWRDPTMPDRDAT